MSRVVLGVAGGIAAYKTASLLRLLTEHGHEVRVVPTEASLHFIGAATWAALSGQPVATSVWDDVHLVPHVRLGQEADLVVVAPATADLLARAAHGMADDLLTSTLLTARCPVVLAPAMHTEMWENPATRANVGLLRSRGVVVIDPTSGRLTGADSGAGRLPEPDALFRLCQQVLVGPPFEDDLRGRHVLISAGGTRESLDPVRYLGNRSSGKQGYALAGTALLRGAAVVLVTTADLPDPAGATVVRVETAEQMRTAMLRHAVEADVVVMAAAVADHRPAQVADHKVKKQGGGTPTVIDLVENPDILAEMSASRARPGQVLVGFAAETGDADGSVLAYGREKLRRKGCDILVVNEVGPGKAFGTDTNAATLLDRDGGERSVPRVQKDVLAHAVWDVVVGRLGGGPG